MISREAIAKDPFGAVLRHICAIALVLVVLGLSVLACGRMQGPLYEATAVVQVQPGVDVAAAKAQLISQQNLLAVVMRHGLTTLQSDASAGQAVAVLRQSVAVHELTSTAGGGLGFDADVAGMVVSVQLPDSALSMRVANDLAQQLLDSGTAGTLRQGQVDLLFYRRDELRLWQETSALRGELEAFGPEAGDEGGRVHNQRQLALMVDQYDHVRRKLAEAEVDARLALSGQAAGFSLLQRATTAEAVPQWQSGMLIGVAGSLLLAVALAFVLDRRAPGMAGNLAEVWRGFGLIWRLVDDPARPIMGVPRYLVISVAVVLGLNGVAALLQ